MQTDVLIIGSGGAGMSAALRLKELGCDVVVTTKSLPTNANTCMAQGGFNASNGEDVKTHIEDTLRSSRGIGSKVMIEAMCQNSKNALDWLIDKGVPFSQTKDGKLEQRFMGGATNKRTYYAQDYTGLKILQSLYDTCIKNEITFKERQCFLNLIATKNKEVKGATFWDIQEGKVETIYAKSVVVATGGYSSIYYGFTTNGFGSSGDGIAATLRAGGYASDLEFVQFHPTALKRSSILISEASRGEGGYLVNSNKERFVDELAPRDVVSRAIANEIANSKEVFLDLRHLGEEKLKHLLPQELKLCKIYEDIDIAKELIPIKSVAHYTMGGIEVDDMFRVKGLRGCFAIGECSNSHIHGANRLGGNSLLEIISSGLNVAAYIKSYQPEDNKIPSEQTQHDIAFIEALLQESTSKINFYEKREMLGQVMYSDAGIIRDKTKLQNALAVVEQMQRELGDMGVSDKSIKNNTNLVDFLEFKNMLEVAQALLIGALCRDESRGAHFRSDFPNEDDTYKAHSLFWREGDALFTKLDDIR